ncbi:MAG TPA: hypothetical protein VF340_08795 [Methyloceanibacter sp.]
MVEALTGLFANGKIVDLVVVFVVLEAIALAIYRRATGRGLTLIDTAVMMLPGVFLLLALKAALADKPWTTIAMLLGLALVAHLGDLWRRIRVS